MAWPVDVSDGQVILASHINAIRDSVKVWQGDVSAANFLLHSLGGMALGLATAAKIGCTTPHTVIARIQGSLHLGGPGQTMNESGLMQVGSFSFVSASNWGGSGAIGQNFAVASVTGGGGDVRYTPLTHPSMGYAALEFANGQIAVYAQGGAATTAGGSVTPTLRALFDANGLALPSLPSSNPGAGSKRLWYDPADGNRVKLAV